MARWSQPSRRRSVRMRAMVSSTHPILASWQYETGPGWTVLGTSIGGRREGQGRLGDSSVCAEAAPAQPIATATPSSAPAILAHRILRHTFPLRRYSRAVIARLVAAAAPVLAALAVAAPAQADTLRAGVGRADIQPPTGSYMMGWVRADAKTIGQHTRLFARALVLERDGRKVALVAEDLNGIPGGMLKDAADMVKDRGFSEQNVLDSASHTHAAQSGYYNFGTYNSIFPSMGTLTDPNRIFDFQLANTDADPALYTFMVRQLATAIRRADDNLGPATAGWGERALTNVTRNRSIEAHLADHGIVERAGSGNATQD